MELEKFFSSVTSTSPLQGEPRSEELNWLRFDWPGFNEPTISIPNIETSILPSGFEETNDETSKKQQICEVEVVPPSCPTVSTYPFPENTLEVSSLNSLSTPLLANDTPVGYELPYRHNRGKPLDRYSLDIEGQRLKSPIVNYVSTKRLPEPLKVFADELSSCQIPTSVEEAMKDPKWVQAMKEEMETLLKNKTWILVAPPKK